MISYPGEILARFDRYEAIARLGPRGRAEMWKAWDPYLERYVLVASVSDLAQTELAQARGDMVGLLERWLGSPGSGAILDFGPPEAGSGAFFVLEWEPVEPVARNLAVADVETPRRPSPASPLPARRGGVILGLAVALATGALIGSIQARLYTAAAPNPGARAAVSPLTAQPTPASTPASPSHARP